MSTRRSGAPRNRLTYGTEAFEQVSQFARGFGEGAGRTRDALAFLAQNPGQGGRTIVSILRLPSVDIQLSESEQGRSLRSHLVATDSRVPTGRFAQAVLATDLSDDLYLSGRRKQALRTNLRRCRDAGITCRDVRQVGELAALRHELLTLGDPAEWYTDWDGLWRPVFVARRADGELLAIANVTVDGRWAWLGQFRTVSERAGAGIARYALHVHMYRWLRAAGVQWLWAGNALNLWPGLQYFQYLLGFEIYNLAPAKRRLRVQKGVSGVIRAISTLRSEPSVTRRAS